MYVLQIPPPLPPKFGEGFQKGGGNFFKPLEEYTPLHRLQQADDTIGMAKLSLVLNTSTAMTRQICEMLVIFINRVHL